jgi:hypothetical protein
MVTQPQVRIPRLTRMVVSGCALSAAFVSGIAVAGGFAGSTTPPTGPPDTISPVASKDALHSFGDCRQLLDWYVEHNLSDVGPYGWKLPPYAMMRQGSLGGELASDSAAARGPASVYAGQSPAAQQNSATGTNVQEVGVDEPDLAKTDGQLLVWIADGNTVVVTDVSGSSPRELSRHRLPTLPGALAKLSGAADLLLVGDHVLVSMRNPTYFERMPTDVSPDGRIASQLPTTTTVLDLDISDPTRPVVSGQDTYSGDVLSMRQYGDVVRVVTTTARPQLQWVRPGAGYDEAEATRANRQLLRQSTIDDWLPGVTTDDGSTTTPECDQVFRPTADAGDATLAVFGYDAAAGADPQPDDAVGLVTDSQVVYSSTDRLYVATSDLHDNFWRSAYDRVTGRGSSRMPEVTTQLHSFALDGPRTSYLASGHVNGSVRDRWSLDEHDGRLRVAVARPGPWGGAEDNAVAVLHEQDGELEVTGQAVGLGPDEDIKAVRWFDDFAVLVTFRQTDPLYTVDLSEPGHPRTAGALKIPGYSGYLHPIGGGRLLGLGQAGDLDGRLRGGQAALFDISDLAAPHRLATLPLGAGTNLLAEYDPHAFTWIAGSAPGTGTALTTLDDANTAAGTAVVRLDVDASATLRADRIPGSAGVRRAVPLDGDRVALVGEDVRIVELG